MEVDAQYIVSTITAPYLFATATVRTARIVSIPDKRGAPRAPQLIHFRIPDAIVQVKDKHLRDNSSRHIEATFQFSKKTKQLEEQKL